MFVCHVTMYKGFLCMLFYFDIQNMCELAITGILSPVYRGKTEVLNELPKPTQICSHWQS